MLKISWSYLRIIIFSTRICRTSLGTCNAFFVSRVSHTINHCCQLYRVSHPFGWCHAGLGCICVEATGAMRCLTTQHSCSAVQRVIRDVWPSWTLYIVHWSSKNSAPWRTSLCRVWSVRCTISWLGITVSERASDVGRFLAAAAAAAEALLSDRRLIPCSTHPSIRAWRLVWSCVY